MPSVDLPGNSPEPKHCDDYIEDATAPLVLRAYLERARAPVHGHLSRAPFPKLFANYKGARVRVVMASRRAVSEVAHVADVPPRTTLCNAVPWRRKGKVKVPKPLKFVTAEEILKLPYSDACGRCFIVAAKRAGLRIVRR